MGVLSGKDVEAADSRKAASCAAVGTGKLKAKVNLVPRPSSDSALS
jgi:hypothetical protein